MSNLPELHLMQRRRKQRSKVNARPKIKKANTIEDNVFLSDLPRDILNEIASRLFESGQGRNGIIALSQVNSQFYKICSQDRYWQYSIGYPEETAAIKLHYLDENSGTTYHNIPSEKHLLYNHPSRIRSLIGPSKKSLLDVRNRQIHEKIQIIRKKYYKTQIPKMNPPILDPIEIFCLFIGHILWVANNIIPINTIIIFLPLFIVSALYCYHAVSALIFDWAVKRPDIWAHYDRISIAYLYGLGCRTLAYYQQYNAPRISGE